MSLLTQLQGRAKSSKLTQVTFVEVFTYLYKKQNVLVTSALPSAAVRDVTWGNIVVCATVKPTIVVTEIIEKKSQNLLSLSHIILIETILFSWNCAMLSYIFFHRNKIMCGYH